MIIYNGFYIPETVQEIMLTSHYGYSSPHLQLSSVETSTKINAGITFEMMIKPEFSMSETIQRCKEVIDAYNEGIAMKKSEKTT